MPGGFVLPDNAVGDCPVENRHGSLVDSCRDFIITRLNRGDRLFDGRSHRRTLARIVFASNFRLSGSLASLGRIGHVLVYLKMVLENKVRYYADRHPVCQSSRRDLLSMGLILMGLILKSVRREDHG